MVLRITGAFLLVLKGENTEVGRAFSLTQGASIIGGSWGEQQPDVAFKDRRISRRHASVVCCDRGFVVTDLPSSTNGTELNGEKMTKGMPYVLKDDDNIGLADGVVILRFCEKSQSKSDQGTEVTRDGEASKKNVRSSAPEHRRLITVNDDRKQVLIGGKPLSDLGGGTREYRMLLLLHNNQDRAVGYEAIKEWVWLDRKIETPPDSGHFINDVTLNEIESVVYLLRKKLGNHARCIESVPRYGYILKS